MTKLTIESTLTEKYQTTIPSIVRQALGLKKGSKITYQLQEDGTVLLIQVKKQEEDPVLATFLDFLTDDMTRHPEQIKLVDPKTVVKVQSLVEGMDVDLDAPLDEDEEN